MKILLLAGNTLRARAYAQYIEKMKSDTIEIEALFFGFKERECPNPKLDNITKHFLNQEKLIVPNLSECIKNTFISNNWKSTEVDTSNVNSSLVLENIKMFDGDIIVFAGYGGQILGKEHFNLGKKYLHMHPGKLPIERGSTTIYYSILNKRDCTVTAFFMSEKIDDGVNITSKQYTIPIKDVNIDIWYDNVIRADCFVSALQRLENNEFLDSCENRDSEEFYVIHPVLKHIALMSLKDL